MTSFSVFIANFFTIHSALSARAMDSDGDSQMRNAEEAASEHGGFRITSLRQGKSGKGKSKSKFDEGKSKSTLGADFDSDKDDYDSDDGGKAKKRRIGVDQERYCDEDSDSDYGGKGRDRRIGVGQERCCDEDSDDDPELQVSGKGKRKGKRQEWKSRQGH